MKFSLLFSSLIAGIQSFLVDALHSMSIGEKGNVDEHVIGFDEKKRVQIIITQAYAMTFDVSTRSFSIPAHGKSMCAAANELRSFVQLIRMRSASIG